MNKDKLLILLKEINKLKTIKQRVENLYKILDENNIFFIKSDSTKTFICFIFIENLVFEITETGRGLIKSIDFSEEEFIPCLKNWMINYQRKHYFKEYQLASIYQNEK